MKLSRSGGRRNAAALAVAVAVGGSVLVAAAPAAADPYGVTISFDSPSDLSVDYGEGWSLTLSSIATTYYYGAETTVTVLVDGEPVTTLPGTAGTRSYGTSQTYFGSYLLDEPLAAGEHEVTATVAGNAYGAELAGQTTAPATITVGPAALAVDLRVETDPTHSANAIVTARLGGDFVERMIPPEYLDGVRSAAVLPAGTWKISIADPTGAAVYTKETPVEAGGHPYLVDYWTDAPAGTTFLGSASFTPSGDTADDFSVTDASNASYTSPAATVTAPVDVPAAPEPAAAVADGPSVPLWLAGAAGLVGLASLIAILLTLLLARRRSTAAGRPDEPPVAGRPAGPDTDTAVLQESAHV